MAQREESDALDRYLAEIARFPSLTPEDERELGARARNGDRDAIRRLVESNLRFVVSYAKKFRFGTVSLLDLIAEGNMGLMHAARKFDPDRKVRFITYAVWWIRQAILHALSEQGTFLRLPPKQANLVYRIGKAARSLERQLERPPSADEIGEELGVAGEEVELLRAAAGDHVSLNVKVDEEGSAELGDLFEQRLVPAPDVELMRASAERQLRELLGGLTAREQKVLRLRYGLDDDEPRTLREISEVLRVSRERVRQIEAAALAKLRGSARVKSLAGYAN